MNTTKKGIYRMLETADRWGYKPILMYGLSEMLITNALLPRP